jgi:hypothetical protein
MLTDIETQPITVPLGPAVEKLNYAVECKDLDYGIVTAPNQLIKRVINPLMDMIYQTLKPDHVVDSKTKYTLSLVITSTRDIDTVQ